MVIALSQPAQVSDESKRVATVVVVDVSESVSDELLQKASSALQRLWSERGDAPVRLLTFAEEVREIALHPDQSGRTDPGGALSLSPLRRTSTV